MFFETQAIHTLAPDPLTGAISVPIYQTSTFVQEAPGVHKGFDYARTNNPTRQALEELIAALEGGVRASAFASGLSAIDAVLKLLESGDHIVAVDDIYGGAFRIFTQIYQKFGLSFSYVDTTDLDAIEAAIQPNTKLIWLESPTNPTLKVSDIAAVAEIAHKHGILLAVDNTFASPALQQPLHLGADIVIHSATKYLGGHSDLIAGLVVSQTEEIGAKIKFIQNASGAILSPHDSWLAIRGIETLDLRVQRHSASALAIAEFLEGLDAVERVYYPGLASHPTHATAKKQQSAFGGVVSFTLKEDTEAAAARVVSATRYFKLAESLGGVKSLICHPATMTHKTIPANTRRKAGVQDSLIRLSVGLENPIDLIQDLTQVLVGKAQESLNLVAV